MADKVPELRQQIAECRLCARHLPAGCRPVVQIGDRARILIIGQAPGSRVHASGIAWDDPSGDRLREWTGMSSMHFYDPDKVAMVPMGFCYPGKAKSGDLPPRPECAPLWHDRILPILPADRLTLLVGSYAQARYLRTARAMPMTERVRNFVQFLPGYFPLPHPSWRSTLWMRNNPWFEADVLPVLRAVVSERL